MNGGLGPPKQIRMRVLVSAILVAVGLILLMANVSGRIGAVVSGLGISAVTTGVMAMFVELVIKPSETAETAEAVAQRVGSYRGLHFLTDRRRGIREYYQWINRTDKQDLFFAGRSVLHRVEEDLAKNAPELSLEGVILRVLERDGSITVLFLDPRCDLIDRLANEEKQAPDQLRRDLRTTLAVVQRLIDRLNGADRSKGFGGHLHIAVYNAVPYFAYHRDDTQAIVGLYFSSQKGADTAAFRITERETSDFFRNHFEFLVTTRGTTLVELDGSRSSDVLVNQSAINEVVAALQLPAGP